MYSNIAVVCNHCHRQANLNYATIELLLPPEWVTNGGLYTFTCPRCGRENTKLVHGSLVYELRENCSKVTDIAQEEYRSRIENMIFAPPSLTLPPRLMLVSNGGTPDALQIPCACENYSLVKIPDLAIEVEGKGNVYLSHRCACGTQMKIPLYHAIYRQLLDLNATITGADDSGRRYVTLLFDPAHMSIAIGRVVVLDGEGPDNCLVQVPAPTRDQSAAHGSWQIPPEELHIAQADHTWDLVHPDARCTTTWAELSTAEIDLLTRHGVRIEE